MRRFSSLTALHSGANIRDVEQSAAQKMVDAMSDAWNRGDADQFTARCADDGTFTNIYGMTFAGREAFRERLAGLFKRFPGSTTFMKVRSVRLARPDVAIVSVDCVGEPVSKFPPHTPADENGVVRLHLLMVLVNERGNWLISAFHNTAVVPQFQPR
jgi:uncharacterized protein (TIGR02246 family)